MTAVGAGSVLVFTDTETTSLTNPWRPRGRRIWEAALIIREPGRPDRELLYQVSDVNLTHADEDSLRIGRHAERWGKTPGAEMVTEAELARIVAAIPARAHMVGAVPDFDTSCYENLLNRHGYDAPPWHYHIIDVETLAIGWLHGRRSVFDTPRDGVLALPWSSDAVAEKIGLPAVDEAVRHTALGDARWVARWYDQVTGQSTVDGAR